MGQTDLSKYDNSWYSTRGSGIKRLLWYFCNVLIMKNHYNPLSSLRCKALRLFGAKVGKGVVIKPGVNVKYPWNLTIGDHTWIGEDVWIDNLGRIEIGSNACISQGAMLLCGNHNFKLSTFDLIVKPIQIKDGAWVGAQCTVCPGVTMGSHSILCVGSVANKDLDPYGIYKGVFATKVSDRFITEHENL